MEGCHTATDVYQETYAPHKAKTGEVNNALYKRMPGEILLSRWKPPAGHRLEDQLDRVGVQVAYNDIGPGQPLGAQLLHEGFQGVGQYPHIANG